VLAPKHAVYPVAHVSLAPLETQMRQQSAEEPVQSAVQAAGDTLGAQGEVVDDERAPLRHELH